MWRRIYYWLHGCPWRLTGYLKPGKLTAQDREWARAMLARKRE